MATRRGFSGRATPTYFETNIRRLVAFQKAALGGVPVYAVAGDPRASEG